MKEKLFRCHKLVHATPMTAGDYFEQSGKPMPEKFDSESDGYRVVYGKDTEDEYVSWSPKKQFDQGYTEVID